MKEKIMKVLESFNEEIVEDTGRNLFDAEILDSFGIVELVVELEDAFNIVIDVDLVTPENFGTADSIVRLVEGLLV